MQCPSFPHRVVARRRRYLISALIPYCYIFSWVRAAVDHTGLGIDSAIGAESVSSSAGAGRFTSFRRDALSPDSRQDSRADLIYLVMRRTPSWRHALIEHHRTALWESPPHPGLYFGPCRRSAWSMVAHASIVVLATSISARPCCCSRTVIAEYERIGSPASTRSVTAAD